MTPGDYEPPRGAKIRRYFKPHRFVELLETSLRFFAWADRFEDPWEGAFPRPTVDLIRKFEPQVPSHLRGGLSDRELPVKLFKNAKLYTAMSCWHMNDGESAAMWSLYASDDKGVAVQSTVGSLWNALPYEPDNVKRIRVGQVKYTLDYDNGSLSLHDIHPYLHKRSSFEHEREVRAILQRIPDTAEELLTRGGPPQRRRSCVRAAGYSCRPNLDRPEGRPSPQGRGGGGDSRAAAWQACYPV